MLSTAENLHYIRGQVPTMRLVSNCMILAWKLTGRGALWEREQHHNRQGPG